MKSTPRNPANRPLALGKFALTLTATAFLLGGTDIARAQSPNPRSSQRVTAGEGGTNSGGTDVQYRAVTNDPWNDGVVDILNHKDYLAVQAWADGEPARAIHIYREGLLEVLSTATATEHRLSWTYKMAERTLALVDRLQALPVDNLERDQRAILLVLQSSYNMIERYYYSLDIQFWIPYYMVVRGHWPQERIHYDINQFETVLNNYSLSQVAWFKKEFARLSTESIIPLFSANVFLTVLSSVARGLAADLSVDPNAPNPNLFPLAYSQAARSLKSLAEEIDNHLIGNGVFSNDERAVNAAYDRLQKIIGYIGH